MSLRDQVDKRLLELRSELEKQLAAMGGAKSMNGKASGNSSLKGRKVPPKYRSPSGETWAGRGAEAEVDGCGSEEGEEDGEFLNQERMRQSLPSF